MKTPTFRPPNSITASFGLFSKLPPEIRALIWDQLLPRGKSRHKTDLAILRTNSILSAEIISHFHRSWKRLEFIVPSRYNSIDYPGFRFVAEGKRNSQWNLASANDALARGLHYLPLHILPIHVIIGPPDRRDPGQLISLWDRNQQLVQLLQSFKRPIKHLIIHLYDRESIPERPSYWLHGSKRRRLNLSIPDPTEGRLLPNFIRSDIQIALLPFSVLNKAKMVDIRAYTELLHFSPTTYGTTKQWLEHIAKSFLPDTNPKVMR